jgi:hypothetical protein
LGKKPKTERFFQFIDRVFGLSIDFQPVFLIKILNEKDKPVGFPGLSFAFSGLSLNFLVLGFLKNKN